MPSVVVELEEFFFWNSWRRFLTIHILSLIMMYVIFFILTIHIHIPRIFFYEPHTFKFSYQLLKLALGALVL